MSGWQCTALIDVADSEPSECWRIGSMLSFSTVTAGRLAIALAEGSAEVRTADEAASQSNLSDADRIAEQQFSGTGQAQFKVVASRA